jgi:hypothetical protein
MPVLTKIVSLIDTVRYRNWPRRLVLIYVYVRFVGGLLRISRRRERRNAGRVGTEKFPGEFGDALFALRLLENGRKFKWRIL